MIKKGQLEEFAAFHKFPCIPLHDQHIDGAEHPCFAPIIAVRIQGVEDAVGPTLPDASTSKP